MAEYISCRSCDSPSCKGCNIYTLSTMLNKGKFDSLMNDNRSINPTANVTEVKHGWWIPNLEHYDEFTCTNCQEVSSEKTCYCPNCGAEMD